MKAEGRPGIQKIVCPAGTTESTTVCPPCTTEIVTDCPVQETTPCPEVTCPTERTTLGPEITCPTIETTSETLPCTCPEITCPTIETTSETLPCTCPEIICPTEGTTHCQECTPCSNEDNATTTISSTSGILQDIMGLFLLHVMLIHLFINFRSFIHSFIHIFIYLCYLIQ
jgi:hypothetical protein